MAANPKSNRIRREAPIGITDMTGINYRLSKCCTLECIRIPTPCCSNVSKLWKPKGRRPLDVTKTVENSLTIESKSLFATLQNHLPQVLFLSAQGHVPQATPASVFHRYVRPTQS